MSNLKVLQTVLMIILQLFSAVGCVGTQHGNQADGKGANAPPLVERSMEKDDSNKPYRLGNGDVIDVKFYYTPELNETLKVRPDGKISLQLVGDVQAGGRTASELAETLKDKYANILHKAEIAVIVQTSTEYRVYVGGEVFRSGAVQLTRGMTVMQAVFNVGGFKNTAHLENILIVRKAHPDASVEYLIANVENVLEEGHEDVLLKPFDVIYVPRTTIAKVNLFVDQYINKVIPIALVQAWQTYLYDKSIRDD